MKFNSFPWIPLDFNLLINPQWKTLSNALEMSKKAAQVSPSGILVKGHWYFIRDLKELIYCGIIVKSRLFRGQQIVFLELNVNFVKYYFSNSFPQIGRREIGLYVFVSWPYSFLWIGKTFAFFHKLGQTSFSRQLVYISFKGKTIASSHIFNIEIETSSHPCALL